MDNTGPIAFKFAAVVSGVGGLYDLIASFIVRAKGSALPLFGVGRGSINETPDPNLYLQFGLMLILLAPALWFVGNKLDED